MSTSTASLVTIPYQKADGATNMAVDEAMLRAARGGGAFLRFYGWEPSCLSLGRNQAAPGHLRGSPATPLRVGVDMVRRQTGGRSVFHGPEITYAFACPDRAFGGPKAVYARFHGALARGLALLGVELDDTTPSATPPDLAPGVASCFRDPAPGELTARGRKLVGSAQCRKRGALLQHGSILLSNRQRLASLGEPESVEDGSGAIGLDELLTTLPAIAVVLSTLEDELRRAFADEGPSSAAASDSSSHATGDPGEIARAARDLEARYRSADWFWRRVA